MYSTLAEREVWKKSILQKLEAEPERQSRMKAQKERRARIVFHFEDSEAGARRKAREERRIERERIELQEAEDRIKRAEQRRKRRGEIKRKFSEFEEKKPIGVVISPAEREVPAKKPTLEPQEFTFIEIPERLKHTKRASMHVQRSLPSRRSLEDREYVTAPYLEDPSLLDAGSGGNILEAATRNFAEKEKQRVAETKQKEEPAEDGGLSEEKKKRLGIPTGMPGMGMPMGGMPMPGMNANPVGLRPAGLKKVGPGAGAAVPVFNPGAVQLKKSTPIKKEEEKKEDPGPAQQDFRSLLKKR